MFCAQLYPTGTSDVAQVVLDIRTTKPFRQSQHCRLSPGLVQNQSSHEENESTRSMKSYVSADTRFCGCLRTIGNTIL
uniref:Uncharacterized protein n=1 Tax=Timema poppense TaxID=170557 RepID=A0A7R9HDG1_TIMPO|nr:unnamed protein product [Timema poppensis]